MDSSDRISVVALVAALVALIIAVGQFLQQIFGTADGYRKCQPSVLGDWAKQTKLKWRWTQFRFEVKFTTPDIFLGPVNFEYRNPILQPISVTVDGKVGVPLDHTGQYVTKKMVKDLDEGTTTDLVGWISLLKQLQMTQEAVFRNFGYTESSIGEKPIHDVKMSLRKWSWDLMPSEVVRPLATTTVGVLVVLAHRLGMTWREIRPSEGILRADGNGQSINSVTVRGLGLVVQYTIETTIFDKALRQQTFFRLPIQAADKLFCGIVPGFEPFNIPDIPFVQSANISPEPDRHRGMSALVAFGLDWKTAGQLMDKEEAHFGLCDLLYICMPFLPQPGCDMADLVNPFAAGYPNCMASREFRLVLRWDLGLYIGDKNRQTQHLVDMHLQLHNFGLAHNSSYVNARGYSEFRNGYGSMQEIAKLRAIWDDTTKFFEPFHSSEKYPNERKDFYLQLVIAHMTMAAEAWITTRENMRDHKNRDDGSIVNGPRAAIYIEACHVYVDKIDRVCEIMQNKGFQHLEKKIIADAWWTLMVRAVVLALATVMFPVTVCPPIPSQYYDSQTPVYIT